jgi:acyl-CoA thioesterase-1
MCLITVLLLATTSLLKAQNHTLVFFGDSLTAGYGLENPELESFPALIQTKITQEHLPWRVVNAGLSGDTTSGGLMRIDWILRQPLDIIFIELGANDGLRGIAPQTMASNLRSIINRIRSKQPRATIVLAGMQMPINYGEAYRKAYTQAFADVAENAKIVFEPFLLDGVGGVAALNQADAIHPNADGARVVADGVWKIIHSLLIKHDTPKR